jgi:hypothetical protein
MISGSVLCSSFKRELLEGVHDFMADTFKIALYLPVASLDSNTTVYTAEGEAEGAGYVPGGMILTSPQVLLDPGARVAFVTFADPTWTNSMITARGALIYNETKQQRAVVVLNFGSEQSSNQGNFRVLFPPPTVSAALIRIL